jgi:hypothetical protein
MGKASVNINHVNKIPRIEAALIASLLNFPQFSKLIQDYQNEGRFFRRKKKKILVQKILNILSRPNSALLISLTDVRHGPLFFYHLNIRTSSNETDFCFNLQMLLI